MNKKDFKIERFRSGGNGGQNVNKVETAIRITHLPTGLAATSQNERSQSQNYKNAMSVLLGRIAEQERIEKASAKQELRKDVLGTGRVRTYNMVTNMVVDHVGNIRVSGAKDILNGELERLRGCACLKEKI